MTQIEKKSTVQIVVDRLSSAIVEGQLKPGDKLPSEYELSLSFNVGRNTVREATRTLIAYGVLEVRSHEGTFVAESFSPQCLDPLIYGLILGKDKSYSDLINFREMLDLGLAFVLMEEGISDQQESILLRAAEAVETAFQAQPVDIDEVCAADIEFHLTLARIAQNQLLYPICSMIANLTRSSRHDTISTMLASGRQRFMIDTHYEIIRCLKGNDVKALYAAIQDSISDWKEAVAK